MQKDAIERMDILSRKKYPRGNLIRISFDKNTGLFNPLDSYTSGKGVYILKDKETIQKVIKKDLLKRIFKRDCQTIYLELEKMFE